MSELGPSRKTVRLVGSVLLLFVLAACGSSMCRSSPTDTTWSPEGFDLQGHRGARGLAPENTIPAFRAALELGVTTLEMDVVLSKDETVVVSHEPWMAHDKCKTPEGRPIDEANEQAHVIYDMTYEEVEAYDCGSSTLSRFPEQRATPAPKPRLRDVIQMAEAYAQEHDREPVFYNIELKSRPEWEGKYQPDPQTFAMHVLRVVSDERVAERTTIQSFDSRILDVVHEAKMPVRTAILVGVREAEGLSDTLRRLSAIPDIYSPAAALVDEDLVEAVHRRGMTVVPWTVNSPAEMKRLIGVGVDGFITDYPDRAKKVLTSRAID